MKKLNNAKERLGRRRGFGCISADSWGKLETKKGGSCPKAISGIRKHKLRDEEVRKKRDGLENH